MLSSPLLPGSLSLAGFPPVPLEAHLSPLVDGWIDREMDRQERLEYRAQEVLAGHYRGLRGERTALKGGLGSQPQAWEK